MSTKGKVTKVTLAQRVRDLIAGTQKHSPNGQLTLGGTAFRPTPFAFSSSTRTCSKACETPRPYPLFSGFAAMRLSVLVTGSTPMPVLSSAATPIDSASESPKVTLVTVSDPIKVTRANP
jgi:hypothetical protein